jgi:hypothetical protein
MAVNLSPLGGAAAQFFTNTGAVLTGGKLYTYLAGTTTPATTYTTSAGDVARTNPIILDSAGRVANGGEIWLTVGVTYKFLLKDSNDVLIGTYDNVPSASSTLASLVSYTPAGAGAVTTTVQAKLRQTVSVKDFGAVGDGVTDDTTAFNNMFATGSNSFQLIAGEQYLIGNVVLPIGSGWELNGNWATLIPKAGSTTCLIGTYTTAIFNTSIRNLNISGNVTDVIKFVCTGSGVLLNCEIDGITARSGTCTTLITLNSTASGQGETLRFSNITVFGANYDYVIYLYGGSSNYGSCEFKNIFHNADTGIATIYAVDGLFLSSFDLIYHTRGSGILVGAGNNIVHSQFTRMETEAVEHGTKLYNGNFLNCSFDVSTVYNQLLSAPYTEQIASGVFKNCIFSNNFVFQTSGTTITLAAGSTRNTVTDLQVGSIEYVQYTTISDAGTFNNFIAEQYISPSASCTGAITTAATYTLVKNGRMVTVNLPAVSGTATAAASFSFGTALPVKYRPTTPNASLSALITDNGALTNTPGLITVGTNGVISVFKSGNQTDTYTAAATSGLAQSVTITWVN